VNKWIGSSSSEESPVARFCEQDNEPSGYIKGGKLIGQLDNYQLLHFRK
jgi:hypothetical protein